MPSKIVLDSSVIVKLLHTEGEEYSDRAQQLLRQAERGTVALYAPEFSKCEVGNALLKGKRISAEAAYPMLKGLYTLPIQFLAESETQAQIAYQIASNQGITYYDATFLAHAKTLNATLVTANPKHQAKDKDITVIPLAQYGKKKQNK
jgi:predicted nucleic acid-binding protein